MDRARAPAGRGDRLHHFAPVLGPTSDTVNQQNRSTGRRLASRREHASAQTHDADRRRCHVHILRSMLFYYLCTVGEQKFREAYPQGSQSKDSDVFKWVTMHSGSPAVCQREHAREDHRWRPDEGGDEERIVRGYSVLQWDKQGFDAK